MDTNTLPEVVLYCDGACTPNPGVGGYGALLMYGSHRRELSGGFRATTNNRMEIMAAIAGLSALKRPCRVTVFSDSRYVVDAIEQDWARRWRAKGWRRSAKEKAANHDLWTEHLDLCDQHEVNFHWIRGHAGDPENDLCDALATAAYSQPELPCDSGYDEGARA